MISIANEGQDIVSTNYWETEHANAGLCYLSGNAGAWRLLVPEAAEHMLAEMRTGKRVSIEPSIIEPGCWDIVFEDGSDSPFALTLDKRQMDWAMGAASGFPFTVWTQRGKQLTFSASARLS